MAQTIEMAGKVAVVTGAASGLGRACALRLAEAGAELALVDRDSARLAETAAAIGRETLVHEADLSRPEACTGAIAAAVERFGRLDALCNIAGVIRMAHSHAMPRADFDLTVAVNLAAPWHLTQAAIPHLLETNGAVVNCASSAAFVGEAYATVYAATKAAVVSMTKSLAMEYMRQPIRFNAVAPGGMATNIAEHIGTPADVDMELMTRYMGLRGLVEVADVAEMVAMLASPAGRSYHGATISIDGGITAG